MKLLWYKALRLFYTLMMRLGISRDDMFVRRFMVQARMLMLYCRTKEEKIFVLDAVLASVKAETPEEAQRTSDKLHAVTQRILRRRR